MARICQYDKTDYFQTKKVIIMRFIVGWTIGGIIGGAIGILLMSIYGLL